MSLKETKEMLENNIKELEELEKLIKKSASKKIASSQQIEFETFLYNCALNISNHPPYIAKIAGNDTGYIIYLTDSVFIELNITGPTMELSLIHVGSDKKIPKKTIDLSTTTWSEDFKRSLSTIKKEYESEGSTSINDRISIFVGLSKLPEQTANYVKTLNQKLQSGQALTEQEITTFNKIETKFKSLLTEEKPKDTNVKSEVKKLIKDETLNDETKEFLKSLLGQITHGKELSQKQLTEIKRIKNKPKEDIVIPQEDLNLVTELLKLKIDPRTREFLKSFSEKLKSGRELSDKQKNILMRMKDRFFADMTPEEGEEETPDRELLSRIIRLRDSSTEDQYKNYFLSLIAAFQANTLTEEQIQSIDTWEEYLFGQKNTELTNEDLDKTNEYLGEEEQDLLPRVLRIIRSINKEDDIKYFESLLNRDDLSDEEINSVGEWEEYLFDKKNYRLSEMDKELAEEYVKEQEEKQKSATKEKVLFIRIVRLYLNKKVPEDKKVYFKKLIDRIIDEDTVFAKDMENIEAEEKALFGRPNPPLSGMDLWNALSEEQRDFLLDIETLGNTADEKGDEKTADFVDNVLNKIKEAITKTGELGISEKDEDKLWSLFYKYGIYKKASERWIKNGWDLSNLYNVPKTFQSFKEAKI